EGSTCCIHDKPPSFVFFIEPFDFQPIKLSTKCMSVNPSVPETVSQFIPLFVVFSKDAPLPVLANPISWLSMYILSGLEPLLAYWSVQFIPPFVVRNIPPHNPLLSTIQIVSLFNIYMSLHNAQPN